MLAHTTQRLDHAAIMRALMAHATTLQVEVVDHIDSTNSELLRRNADVDVHRLLLAAEWQTAGRGRRGRQWTSAPGGSLTFSLGWRFEQGAGFLSGLSLAVGVAIARALEASGYADVELKWPNDLVHGQRKLGGILIELKSEAGGPLHVVVGIGLNVALGDAITRDVAATGNRAVDLASLGVAPDRNALIAAFLESGVQGLATFAQSGFASFGDDYRDADVLAGQRVVVAGTRDSATGTVLSGTALGIDADGALLVQTPGGVERVLSGDVSVRAGGLADEQP